MRVYLAGTSGISKDAYQRIKQKNNSVFILETFASGEKICIKSLELAGSPETFLLDSGAFSFMGSKKITKSEMLVYADKYIDFINKYNIKYFVEMDVYTVFGIEFTNQLRKRIEKGTKKKCIPVWHKILGIPVYEKWCKEYKYIAIGCSGKHDSKWCRTPQGEIILSRLINYATKKGVKVHGLGYTVIKNWEKIPFYSVDSTRWCKDGEFLKVDKYEKGTITQTQLKTTKKINYANLHEHNINEWIKLQKMKRGER